MRAGVLREQYLIEKEMNALAGGRQEHLCTCFCYREGRGGSSSSANSSANYDIPGGYSAQGDNLPKSNMPVQRQRFYRMVYSDIPIDNGPWKFGGLPGMKVYDNDKKFVFECIGIQYKQFSIIK
ncbi:MAG: hypothetical protein LBC68_06010 [Prevotellaceae bacterium]|nr:hypothetical protein [Prevotellaceae bacterium]